MQTQQRSREILAQARQEHLLQEAWAGEIHELYIRAELEGVDISTTTASVWTGEEEKEAAAVERGEEEFLYLTHSTRKSETRLRSLLSHLEAAQAAPSYRDELSRLHRETVRYSTKMVAAAVRRQELAVELDEAEQTRASVEEKRDETVLDLVLDWKDRWWFRPKPDNVLGDLSGEGASKGQHKDLEREGSSWRLYSVHNAMLSWLASWFFSSGGTAAPPAAPGAPQQLSEEQLNELHAQWIRMQSSHQAEAQRLLGRLVEENNTLKAALEAADRDLKDVRAGRKADEEALKKAQSEIHRLTGGDRNGDFVRRAVSNGLFASPRQFDEFLNSFNRVHPLFTLFVHNGSHEETRQRERAFAALAAQNPLCYRLLLGRWAYDLALAEVLAPAKGTDAVAFPRKIVFVEPVVGFYLSSHLRKREPRIIEAGGLLRKHPLDGPGKLQSTLHIDFSRHPPPELRTSISPSRPSPAHPSNPSPSAGSAGIIEREAAAAPSSARMALERMLAAAVTPSVQPSPRGRGGTEAPVALAAKPTPPSVLRKHHLAPQSPFGHPLSLADAASALGRQHVASATGKGDADAVDMTDEELADLLAKIRREEEEYEKGLAEDPFAAGAPSPGAAASRKPPKSNGVS
ncbi:hypothetical protein Rhopal_001374-T1 [Rhodotorula paludigena]|uniref:DUF7923 domain-containing protein n=1 Tax=Rhodotorula paludigena TaxID=86838 RepID=A0AAV5GE54_9BASI|nr:hypothetical protein Rhopal_001374-T1 [Rhodotorula paludigena]